MSTTPRTAAFCERPNVAWDAMWIDFARQLEIENRAFRAEQKTCADCFGITNKELAQLRADAARLDWLDENMSYVGGGAGGLYSFFTPADLEGGMLRYAIDAAMAQKNHPKSP